MGGVGGNRGSRVNLDWGWGDHLVVGGVAGPELSVSSYPMGRRPVTRRKTRPRVRVVSLGGRVGERRPGQRHGRVLPVVGVVGLVSSLGLGHT